MKKTILLLTVLFFYGIINAQCPQGDITLTTQQEVDDFATTYPGCTELLGDITIEGSDITSLEGLNQLRKVSGRLLIGYCYNLNSLSGLENIIVVEGDIKLYDNDGLINLNGLNGLNTIGGSLIIGDFLSGNSSLLSLSGLENLNTIEGNLVVERNQELDNLTGLEGLNTVGGSLTIKREDKLTNLNGLNSLNFIGAKMFIDNNHSLVTLEGLGNIEVGVEVSVTSNDILTSLSGVENVSCPNFKVRNNEMLSACEALCLHLSNSGSVNLFGNLPGCNNNIEIITNCPSDCSANVSFSEQNQIDNFIIENPGCTTVLGTLFIYDSGVDPITNLNGLSQLTSIEGDLQITDNETLINLSGLDNLTEVGGSLLMRNNPNLINLSGLDNLFTIGGDLNIGTGGELNLCFQSEGNNFHNLEGLNSLTTVEGTVNIRCSSQLEDLSGLNNLNIVGGNFNIVNNDKLSNLVGLEGLNTIGNKLDIRSNSLLTALTGLDNLNTVSSIRIGRIVPPFNFGDLPIPEFNPNLNDLTTLQNITSSISLYIEGNSNLISLAGLDNIEVSDLYIRNNSNLSMCSVLSVCNYLSNNNESIYSNASGCNSQAEIMFGCPQSCPQGSITLSSQQQIDDFSQDYLNCMDIPGDIIVEESNLGNITNLNGLSTITSIGGYLHIKNNSQLSDISGLQNLSAIGTDMYLDNNDAIIDFTEFGNLGLINGDIIIANNDNLNSLTGLQNIFYGGINNLSIQNNPNLSFCTLDNLCTYLNAPLGTVTWLGNASGCEDYTSIVSACNDLLSSCLSSGITFSSQEDITDFAIYYPYCTEILGDVTINGVDDLSELSQLTAIYGNLHLNQCNLSDFKGLNNINTINGGFKVKSCKISNFSGLDSLTTIEDYFFIQNTNLSSFLGLENLTTIGGNFRLGGISIGVGEYPYCDPYYYYEGSYHLTDFEGLNNLQSIGGGFTVSGNDKLHSFQGLTSLDSIGGVFNRGNNPNLKDFQGLENLKSMGGFSTDSYRILRATPQDPYICHVCGCEYAFEQLVDDSYFTSFNGLSSLQIVRGSFRIFDNDSIVNFEGLENLHTIEGSLSIGSDEIDYSELPVCTNLQSLEGLNNLSTVGNVYITGNQILTDLTGVENVDYTTISNVNITGNNLLEVCNVQSICNYLENAGSATINNNAPGCNSRIEVENACTALSVEILNPLEIYLKDRAAILTWRTETEINNTGFEMQRSKDGINWEKIGWQNGQGTTTTSHFYTHRDANPLSGTSYYRLKQVDFDGQFDYSNIVSLHNKPEHITAYPIPAKDVVIFDVPNIAAADELILYDITGKQISRQAFPQDKQLAVSHLNDGVYIYRIFYADEVYSGKIVVK